MLSYFDFLIFVFMAEVISSTFFPQSSQPWMITLQTIGLFAAGYLARPIGGILIGQYADKHGRKPAFFYSLAAICLTTLAIGFLPSYAQVGILAPILFLILRIFQGAAFGGQVPSAWVFVAEHLPARHMAIGCSYIVASYLCGILLCMVFFTLFTNAVSQVYLMQFGWRLPFFIGGGATLAALLLLRTLKETPTFLQLQNNGKVVKKSPLKLMFKRRFNGFFTAMMLTWFTSSLILIIAVLQPSLIQISYALPEGYIQVANGLGILFMILGCLFYGFLADRMNAGKVLMGGSLILITQTFAFYYHLQSDGDFLLVLSALLGFASGIIGMVPSIMIRLFPARVRMTGMAFSYNMMYALVGAIVPFALRYGTELVSFTPVLYITFLCLTTIIMGYYLYRLPSIDSIENFDSF